MTDLYRSNIGEEFDRSGVKDLVLRSVGAAETASRDRGQPGHVKCAGRDRIATLCELVHRTRLWNKVADRSRRKINRRFTAADTRRVFKYRAGTTPGLKD
jgi:hypothetical protein